MAYKSQNIMFRDLTDKEEASFRQWARDNWKLGDEINSVWHPVAQDECRKMQQDSDKA